METTEIKAQPVQFVTIKNKIPLFKGEEQATSIEKIELEEYGFSLVAQKDLYQIGDKAVYIEPDYSLSDITLFDSFIRPLGNPKKSKLGSHFRIRAVKFNLHTGDNEPTYSVGILLPTTEVVQYLNSVNISLVGLDLTKALGITKWEEPEVTNQSGNLKTGGGANFPYDIYKTDENNINKMWGVIQDKIGYPVRLIGTFKSDGSSISIIFKNGKVTVGSRQLIKQLRVKKVVGVRKPNLFEIIRSWFGYKPDLRILEEVDSSDNFVILAKPYIDKVIAYFGSLDKVPNIILRGEASGNGWRGSGNKNNPSSNEEPNIKFFGVDDYNSVATKVGESEFNNYIIKFGFNRCPVIFDKEFNNREEIEKECNSYFKNNMVEGIVLRTHDSNFSCKFMNNEYDANK